MSLRAKFSETTALCCKNISIMPDAPDIVLCSQLCGHNPTDPTDDDIHALYNGRADSSNQFHVTYLKRILQGDFMQRSAIRAMFLISNSHRLVGYFAVVRL